MQTIMTIGRDIAEPVFGFTQLIWRTSGDPPPAQALSGSRQNIIGRLKMEGSRHSTGSQQSISTVATSFRRKSALQSSRGRAASAARLSVLSGV
jgi:hypothetical protein